jgi:hypothetical protein
MTKPKADLAEELPPRDVTPLKYNLKDLGTWIDPKRVSDFIDRVFGPVEPA